MSNANRSPAKLSTEQKAAVTNSAAWTIISAEKSARDLKTERLRKLRLEEEAKSFEEVVKKTRRGK